MMKTARGIMVLILSLFFFSACAHVTTTDVKKPASPVLARIINSGELVMGTTGSMPPLNMTTKEWKVIGYEADIARYMADAMGVKLTIETMPFSELLPALESGKVDMVMSGMTITPKRNMKVAFVGPYLISGKAFLTKRKALASVKDASEINSPNTTLAALEGSTSQDLIEALAPEAKLVLTKNYDEAVAMVLEDKVDSLVADYAICVVSVLRYPDRGLVSVITTLTYEPIGIALPAEDPLFVNLVENLLNTIEGSGDLERIKARWVEDASWLKELP